MLPYPYQISITAGPSRFATGARQRKELLEKIRGASANTGPNLQLYTPDSNPVADVTSTSVPPKIGPDDGLIVNVDGVSRLSNTSMPASTGCPATCNSKLCLPAGSAGTRHNIILVLRHVACTAILPTRHCSAVTFSAAKPLP